MRLHTSALLTGGQHLACRAPTGNAVLPHAAQGRRGREHQDMWPYRQPTAALLPALLLPSPVSWVQPGAGGAGSRGLSPEPIKCCSRVGQRHCS